MRRSEVVDQLRTLGVREDGVLLVHTSWRAVRPVEGGPQGLVAALREALGPEGTLVLPSTGADDDTPYDPKRTPADPSLGILPEIFRTLPGVLRSDHPLGCAAIGPLAPSIVGDPLPIPIYVDASPYARVHEHDGQVLLLGCGHESDTTLHLAEAMAGVPYGVPRHVTVLGGGRPVRIDYLENDHCCQRFALADDWLWEAGLQREGSVGSAHARLARSRDIVAEATRRLIADPLLFLHRPEEGCEDCDLARSSVNSTPACSEAPPPPSSHVAGPSGARRSRTLEAIALGDMCVYTIIMEPACVRLTLDENRPTTCGLPRLLVLAATLLTSACSSSPVEPDSAHWIVGQWVWVQSTGGISGETRTPESEGFSLELQFQGDGDILIYRDGSLETRGEFEVQESEEGALLQKDVPILGTEDLLVALLDEHLGQPEPWDPDTMALVERCDDCFVHVFTRIP